MQGLDIAEEYYRQFGASAIHENFPELEGLIAIGLAGSGSECCGFDDELSLDHDFEPGFCIWIPEEDKIDSRTAFRLERMYAKLPDGFMGLKKNQLKPAGGVRHGVIRISEFLENHIGRKDAELSLGDWFNIPEYALSEVVNGAVWRDDSGYFTEIRRQLSRLPEDVRLKKLAGCLYLMGQSGRYNFERCVMHGEKGAAQLSLAEYAKHTLHTAFLINKKYMPYYKWAFRALRELDFLSELGDSLEYLLSTANEPENISQKLSRIDECDAAVINALRRLGLSDRACNDLGSHADCVNGKIRDSFIRNTDLLAGVSDA